MTWITRLRGVVGTAVTWATGWAMAGAAWGAGLTLLWPEFFRPTVIGSMATSWGALGLGGGVVFAVALRAIEGKRRFAELSMGRFATLGALGGGTLGLGLVLAAGNLDALAVKVVAVVVTTLLGAGCAVGSLAVARRGDALPPGYQDGLESLGLTAEERRDLLGEST